jgi:hypothetical protein
MEPRYNGNPSLAGYFYSPEDLNFKYLYQMEPAHKGMKKL